MRAPSVSAERSPRLLADLPGLHRVENSQLASSLKLAILETTLHSEQFYELRSVVVTSPAMISSVEYLFSYRLL